MSQKATDCGPWWNSPAPTAPSSRPAGEIIRIVDGPLALAPCVSPRLGFRKCDCPDLQACALREALNRARDAMLDGYSLADAARSGPPEAGSAPG